MLLLSITIDRLVTFLDLVFLVLSRRVLPEMEIKISEKSFDYDPIHNKITVQELKQDFEELCHIMGHKWYFHIEPTPEFSTITAFNSTFTWKPPNNSHSLETFKILVEKKLFEISKAPLSSILTIPKRNDNP